MYQSDIAIGLSHPRAHQLRIRKCTVGRPGGDQQLYGMSTSITDFLCTILVLEQACAQAQ